MQSMIAHLRGRLLIKHPNQAIVDVGGVGYEVTITVPTFSELAEAGQEVALHIHTHVREDQIALFGFLRAEEKRLFEKLMTVSGIGPKLAVTILSGMPVGELIGSIRAGNRDHREQFGRLHAVYEGARRHGLLRIVFASSKHAVGMHRVEEQARPRLHLRPDGWYGLSKVWGEG